MNEFSLTDVIEQVLDRSDQTEVHQLVNEVLAAIKPRDRQAALVQALPSFVSKQITTRSLAALPAEEDPPPANQAPRDAHTALRGGGRNRWKGMGDRYAALLDRRIAGPAGFMRLGDMTADDLIASAARRRAHAAGAIENAEKLEKLAGELTGKQTVADLPETFVEGVFQ